MSAVSGVNLAMLPADESEFLDWLSTTGDIWATYYLDESGAVQYEPLPAKEFLERFAARVRRHDSVHLFLGHRQDVLKPRIHTVTIRSAPGRIRSRRIDEQSSLLICYRHGLVDSEGIMDRTSVYYYPSFLKGDTWVKKPVEWVKWARKVVGWLRRRGTKEVPVYRCNDSIPATPLAKEAVRMGLKVT